MGRIGKICDEMAEWYAEGSCELMGAEVGADSVSLHLQGVSDFVAFPRKRFFPTKSTPVSLAVAGS
jgi:hypothetical protein